MKTKVGNGNPGLGSENKRWEMKGKNKGYEVTTKTGKSLKQLGSEHLR